MDGKSGESVDKEAVIGAVKKSHVMRLLERDSTEK